MYENLCGNSVGRMELTMCIKKNQMHAYEMSYNCQLYPTHSCHIHFRTQLPYLSTTILNHPIKLYVVRIEHRHEV
jgi:hypothetical protein